MDNLYGDSQSLTAYISLSDIYAFHFPKSFMTLLGVTEGSKYFIIFSSKQKIIIEFNINKIKNYLFDEVSKIKTLHTNQRIHLPKRHCISNDFTTSRKYFAKAYGSQVIIYKNKTQDNDETSAESIITFDSFIDTFSQLNNLQKKIVMDTMAEFIRNTPD